jgi:hypothetical protein
MSTPPDHAVRSDPTATLTIQINGTRGGDGASLCTTLIGLLLAERVPVELTARHPTRIDDLAVLVGRGPAHRNSQPMTVTPTFSLGARPGARAAVVILDAGLLSDRLTGSIDSRTKTDGHHRHQHYVVIRGPSYLSLRTLARWDGPAPDGLVVVREAGRAMGPSEVEKVTGVAVAGTIEWDADLATVLDAGLLPSCLPRLHQVAGLARLIDSIAQAVTSGSNSNWRSVPSLCPLTTATRSAKEESASGLNTG